MVILSQNVNRIRKIFFLYTFKLRGSRDQESIILYDAFKIKMRKLVSGVVGNTIMHLRLLSRTNAQKEQEFKFGFPGLHSASPCNISNLTTTNYLIQDL